MDGTVTPEEQERKDNREFGVCLGVVAILFCLASMAWGFDNVMMVVMLLIRMVTR